MAQVYVRLGDRWHVRIGSGLTRCKVEYCSEDQPEFSHDPSPPAPGSPVFYCWACLAGPRHPLELYAEAQCSST